MIKHAFFETYRHPNPPKLPKVFHHQEKNGKENMPWHRMSIPNVAPSFPAKLQIVASLGAEAVQFLLQILVPAMAPGLRSG